MPSGPECYLENSPSTTTREAQRLATAREGRFNFSTSNRGTPSIAKELPRELESAGRRWVFRANSRIIVRGVAHFVSAVTRLGYNNRRARTYQYLIVRNRFGNKYLLPSFQRIVLKKVIAWRFGIIVISAMIATVTQIFCRYENTYQCLNIIRLREYLITGMSN